MNGRTYQRAFETSRGIVDFKYVAEVEGALSLNNAGIFPRFSEELELGHGEVRAFLRDIANEAKSAGFERLRIRGIRIKNRRIAEITINLLQ